MPIHPCNVWDITHMIRICYRYHYQIWQACLNIFLCFLSVDWLAVEASSLVMFCLCAFAQEKKNIISFSLKFYDIACSAKLFKRSEISERRLWQDNGLLEYNKFIMHTHLTFKARGYIFQWHCSGALFLIHKMIKLN